MKPLLYLIPVCAILSSCHGPSGSSPAMLNPRNLYSPDTVRMAMSGGDEQAAGKKLQEAVNAYKKGKDTLKSVGLFKEAILLKPTPKGYYELAGA